MSRPSPEEAAEEAAEARYQEERLDRYICAALTGILAAGVTVRSVAIELAVKTGREAVDAADKAAS